jgi:hypothetical protein
MTTAPPFVMLFGKHKGAAISEVPGSYLDWLADPERIETWYPDTRHAIEKEVERRKQSVPEAGEPVMIDPEALIAAGVRALSQRHAGDHAAMRQVQSAAGRLRVLVAPPRASVLDAPHPDVPF